MSGFPVVLNTVVVVCVQRDTDVGREEGRVQKKVTQSHIYSFHPESCM